MESYQYGSSTVLVITAIATKVFNAETLPKFVKH